MSATDPAGGGIEIRGLTVKVGERALLSGASADFPAGGVTLLVGASGSGKTVLLKVLAGLLGPAADGEELADGGGVFEVTGSIRIGGVEVLGGSAGEGGRPDRGARGARPPTGIVFQTFALFDELSAAENIQFALDHRPAPRPESLAAPAIATGPAAPTSPAGAASPARLLEELGLPARTPVSALSGGQKQRLAIARTLAYDPPVIIYDEPTSGLDPANAARVAERIREAGRVHGKTTVVVTHDYESLANIADRIYLLDAAEKALAPIAREDIDGLARRMDRAAPAEVPPPRPEGIGARAGRLALALLAAEGAALETAFLSLLYLVPRWRSARWGLRYFAHYLRLVASPSSCLYFGAAGLIAGFVSTHFVFKFLPHKNYTEPLISDDLLAGLGFALYRILVPVLLTILVAARCAAAVASDVGNRVYGHGIDAMRSLGARPPRYLLTGILHAFLAGTPVLIALGFLAARWTSLAVYVYNYPAHGPDYWDGNFHRDLRIPGELLYRGTGWLLAKVLAAGVGVGAIAYHVGMRPKASGVDVSKDITATIIWATLYVLLVHFAFAFVEFEVSQAVL